MTRKSTWSRQRTSRPLKKPSLARPTCDSLVWRGLRGGGWMRGSDRRSGELFSYVDVERRIRRDHPLRSIRGVVNEALDALSGQFAALYGSTGRPSIPPEMLLRAMLLQAFYSIRSERQLMARLEFDLLFRWFVGLSADEPAWDHSMRGSRWCPATPNDWRRWK